MRGRGRLFGAVLLSGCALAAVSARAANIGSGFGESMLVLTSARQAGSGGLALEDPWRQGSLFDASTVILTSGLRWMGAGYQGGLGSALRVGGELFSFAAPDSTRTLENPDGTYAGEAGTVSSREWGGRALGQLGIFGDREWKVALLGRVSGVMQDLSEESNSGLAIESGLQAQRIQPNGKVTTAWFLLGPLGSGGGHGFAGQVTCGAALLATRASGFLRGTEGYSVGLEGQWLTDGLVNGGLGGVYWFGRPGEPGATFFVRGGLRYAAESAQTFQPRAGLGVIWRTAKQWGLQFDYAAVPIGELGMYHYATVGVRLPPRSHEGSLAGPAAPKGEVAVFPAEIPEESVIYFFPDRGEKAAVNIQIKQESIFGAILFDQEGRFVRTLVTPEEAPPGTYRVEWDGIVEYGMRAKYEIPFFIQISANNETIYRKAVVKEPR